MPAGASAAASSAQAPGRSAAASATPTTARRRTRSSRSCAYPGQNGVPDSTLLFEVRGLETRPYSARQGAEGVTVGNVFHCTDGYLVFTNYSTAIAYDKDGAEIRRFTGGGDHFGNFFAAVRANRRETLHGEINEGHLSSALCHLANISYRLGQPQPFTPEPSAFNGNAVAHEALERMKTHLTANNVNLANTQLRVGPLLNLDVAAETFQGNADASRMLTREYRQGFEVPARF